MELILKRTEFLRNLLMKWLWCSWAHFDDRCYPTVWDAKIAQELGIKYEPNFWHCTRCHPCGESFDKWS